MHGATSPSHEILLSRVIFTVRKGGYRSSRWETEDREFYYSLRRNNTQGKERGMDI